MNVFELIWSQGFWFVVIAILLFIPIVIRPVLNALGYNKWISHLFICRGWHRPCIAYGFHIPRIWFIGRRKTIKRVIRFKKNSLHSVDKHINKLFGFSVGLGIHKHSYRAGWSSLGNGKGVFYSYCYIAGERVTKELGAIEEGVDYIVFIDYIKHYIAKITLYSDSFREINKFEITPSMHSWFGWKLFCYIGGEKPAKRKIKLIISKG